MLSSSKIDNLLIALNTLVETKFATLKKINTLSTNDAYYHVYLSLVNDVVAHIDDTRYELENEYETYFRRYTA